MERTNSKRYYILSLLAAACFVVAFVYHYFPIRPVRAATFTVCASGCDYTTLTAANTANPLGNNTYLIQATYDPSGETYPISLNNSNNIYDCQNSGAVIGIASGGQRVMAMGNGNTLRNCIVTNMRINVVSSNQTISDNTFVTSTAVSMFLSSVQNFTISNNNGINDVYINGSTGNGIFSGNTFDLNSAGWSPDVPILFGAAVTNTVFVSNTFHGRLTAFTTFVTGYGTDLTFASNTFDFAVNPTGAGVKHTILDFSGARITVRGNKMMLPTSDAGTQFMGVYLSPTNSAVSTTATVINNTIKIPVGLNGSSGGPVGVWAGSTAALSTTVTSSYNIIASTSTNPNSIGILLSKAAGALTLNNDYNDFYNITTNLSLVSGASGSLGAGTRTSDPYFRIKDASTLNDFDLAPFSTFLSVNGTFIGADPGPRRSTIYIDPLGTIDYSSVDTTSTAEAAANLMTGDTMQLAAGAYSAFTVASTTLATSSITVNGAGASTIISGSGSANALTIQGLDTCTLQSVYLQSAGASFAGVKFASSTNCTVSSVTSTGNGYGVWFAGSSTGTSFTESTVTSSVSFDIVSTAPGDNSLKNTLFTFASTSLGASSTISTYFKARAFVLDDTNAAVAGASSTLTNALGTVSSPLPSDGTGYSSYSSYLLAAVLTSTSSAITTGGYNPFTLTTAASSTKLASSTQQNLSQVNQTFSITLYPTPTPPPADNGPAEEDSGSAVPPGFFDKKTTSTIVTTTPVVLQTSTEPVLIVPVVKDTSTPPIKKACTEANCLPHRTSTIPIVHVDTSTPPVEKPPVNVETTTEIVTPTETTHTNPPTSSLAALVRPQRTRAEKLFAFATATYGAFRESIDDPAVKKAAATKVTPVTIAVTGAAVAAFVSWADLLALLRYLFLQPSLLLGLRRRRGWGQVYNALNKLPVDLATVRLIDEQSGRVVATRVTDSHGRYAFIAQPGRYRILVVKNNLVFPSTLLSGFSDDGRRTDIYHGEPIAVSEKDAVITANIPLDPRGETRRPRRLFTERLLRIVQITFSLTGLFITFGSTLIAPRWYMFPLLGLHVLLIVIFSRLAIPSHVKSWGIVYDAASSSPIGRTIVRLYNLQFNKLVDMQITDGKGRYYFLAGDNRYQVSFEHPTYSSYTSEALDLSGSEADTIAVDVGLRKASLDNTGDT